MRVLCTGDLHIGRRPSRLPLDAPLAELSTAAMWEAVVDHAIDQRVDLVALSGDVVDRANRFFEAQGPLERGLRRLKEHGIRTLAVAGNHDFDVLPQLHRALGPDTFRLIGAGGTWDRETVTVGDETLHVVGWSFPKEHVKESPLASYPYPAADDGIPVLGLLHADLGVAGSSYAPVTLAELRARPVDCWLLGHVHAPALHDDGVGASVLYPGSPQPMDPGEPGAHGVWLLELRRGVPPHWQRIPLASVCYDMCEVDVTDVATDGDLRERVGAGVLIAATERVVGGGPLRWLSLRVRVTGRTPMHARVPALLGVMADDLALDVGDVRVVVERVITETRPAYDLVQLAEGHDATGVLARLALGFAGEREEPACETLLHQARATEGRLRTAKPYQRLERHEPPDDAALKSLLAARTRDLLDALLRQREVAA